MQLTETDQQSQARQVIDINEAIDLEKVGSEMRSFLEIMNRPMSVEAFDACVDEIGEFLKKYGHDECPHPYAHQFAEGLYYRQVTKPPLEFVLGRRHKLRNQNIVLSGTQILFTHDGPILMTGPTPFLGEAGARKLTLTLTEVVFANIFPNPDNCQDIEQLEDRYGYEDDVQLMDKEDIL
jgi:hypothetical protein